jgi:hypothetical protein
VFFAGATPVNLTELGSPAFWFGNGHKWYAKRAFLSYFS